MGDILEYKELTKDEEKLLLSVMQEKAPYWTLLGIEIVNVKKGQATLRLPFSDKLTHPFGVAHGGAIFSLADSAVAISLVGMIDRSEIFTTIEMKINYIKSFSQGEITATASIISRGARTAVGDVLVKNESGELVAKALATYMIIKKA